jgi:hypothetical protein
VVLEFWVIQYLTPRNRLPSWAQAQWVWL